MSLGRYLAGLLELALMIGPLAVGAQRVRRRLAPAWTGAVARLAETVLVLGTVLAVAHALGAVGLFEEWPLVVACAAIGAMTILRIRPMPLPPESAAPRVDRAQGAVALGVVALVVSRWMTWVAQAFDFGIGNSDSVWYHLPIAARFVQTGSLTRLHYLNGEALVTYYPADVPLLHAIGMLLFERDVLSLVINLGALAVALLAGWCIGRHWRQGPIGVVAVALTLALPIVVTTMAGTAKDDVLALAMLLSAVAFALHSRGERGPLVLSGLAAGVALGSKLTMLVPVLVLGIGVVWVWRRSGAWARVATAWVGGAVATGAFWYVRNLVAIGNPVPGLGRAFSWLPLPTPATPSYERFGSTIADVVTDSTVWDRVFLPGAAGAFGRVAPVLVPLALVGVAAVLVRCRGIERVAALVAVGVALAYPFVPGSAYGATALPRLPTDDAVVFLFGFNLRYVAPGLALALGMLGVASVRGRPRTSWPALLVLAACVALVHTGAAGGDAWNDGHDLVAIAAGIVVLLGGGLLAARHLVVTPAWRAVGASVLAAVLLLAAWPAVRESFHGRYQLVDLYTWSRRQVDARIAVAGFPFQYPLYGEDLSNRVQYVGQKGVDGSFSPVSSCAGMLEALRKERAEFIVVPRAAPTEALGYDLARWHLGLPQGEPPATPSETLWVRRIAGATRVHRTPDALVFRLPRGFSETRCAPAAGQPRAATSRTAR